MDGCVLCSISALSDVEEPGNKRRRQRGGCGLVLGRVLSLYRSLLLKKNNNKRRRHASFIWMSAAQMFWHAALTEAPPVPRWDSTCISDLVLHRRMSQYDPRCRSSRLHHQRLQAEATARPFRQMNLLWRRRRAAVADLTPTFPSGVMKAEMITTECRADWKYLI